MKRFLWAGLVVLTAHAAMAQSVQRPQAAAPGISCPPRVTTDSARAVGELPPGDFRLSIQGSTIAFLMDIELHAGDVGAASAIAPTTSQALRRSWTLAASGTNYSAACRYEGGILLTKPIPAGMTSCAATLLPRNHGDGGWWYFGGASVLCR